MRVRQTLIIVNEAQQEAAEAAMVAVLGSSARGTFATPYKKGSKNYYVSCLRLTPEQEKAFRAQLQSDIGAKRVEVFPGKGKQHLKQEKGLAGKKRPTRAARVQAVKDKVQAKKDKDQGKKDKPGDKKADVPAVGAPGNKARGGRN